MNGTGTGEDLTGILNTAASRPMWSSGETTPVADTKADALRRAATLAYLAYEPTGIIVHPSDWEDIELTKNTQGTYLLPCQLLGAESRVWRIPVIDTPAIAAGTLVGTGAQLYDREAATIRISSWLLRAQRHRGAEERLALAVKRPVIRQGHLRRRSS